MTTVSPDAIERNLRNRLAEAPTHAGELWCAYWGAADERGEGRKESPKGGREESKEELPLPKNVAAIAADLASAERSHTVLVHGRYGTGKSSFLEALKVRIAPESFVLWLDMASITSHIASTALAAVMARIAAKLQDKASDLGSDGPDFGTAVEDLWWLEAGALGHKCANKCAVTPDRPLPPEDNRMAGTAFGDSGRALAANTLEARFDDCLEKQGKRLTVFLDDLDRCERRVALDVVRLLLRCSGTRRIHFVLASDWDVLEQGVKDWMAVYGKADHGEPLVTANSALEKYIHTAVELPGMGRPAVPKSTASVDPWLVELLEKHGEVLEEIALDALVVEAYARPMLAEIFVAGLLSNEKMGDSHG